MTGVIDLLGLKGGDIDIMDAFLDKFFMKKNNNLGKNNN